MKFQSVSKLGLGVLIMQAVLSSQPLRAAEALMDNLSGQYEVLPDSKNCRTERGVAVRLDVSMSEHEYSYTPKPNDSIKSINVRALAENGGTVEFETFDISNDLLSKGISTRRSYDSGLLPFMSPEMDKLFVMETWTDQLSSSEIRHTHARKTIQWVKDVRGFWQKPIKNHLSSRRLAKVADGELLFETSSGMSCHLRKLP